VKCQTSITVGHEDLRTVEDFDISTAPGGLHYVNNPNGVSPTSRPSTSVLGRQVGDSRLIGGRPPSAVCGRRVL
jgi:hypothetical protein